ncbi:MAG: hypothetical protein A3E01_18785 [Gammaproteobacteria bacterium RIFCSPHIGHO2_12_FULL_63_22]|nr:MAG: hypothetical protein A3E01_18785 [Gammaproteobacteria bacterium RIFCSPHIGHO2_12_FULL_63_22]
MAADALLIKFNAGETRNTVTRQTVKLLAETMGFNETQVTMYALARLREQVIPAYLADAPDLSEKAIASVRAQVNQDDYVPTRSLIQGL